MKYYDFVIFTILQISITLILERKSHEALQESPLTSGLAPQVTGGSYTCFLFSVFFIVLSIHSHTLLNFFLISIFVKRIISILYAFNIFVRILSYSFPSSV